MKNYTGKKIVIMGAARQGQALARFFTKRGAQVVLTDTREKEQLSEELAVLENLPVSLTLADIILRSWMELIWFVSQAASPDYPVYPGSPDSTHTPSNDSKFSSRNVPAW
jgi:NAD(P)-dependent dehydrogenase (short-subunit alcohol dehydrogenase family)